MGKASARLALVFAAFLAVAEVARNWGDWGYWAWWVVDYVAVGLLTYGGVRTLRSDVSMGLTPLAGAWGFTTAMFYTSFFSHIENITQPDHGPIAQVPLTIAIGILFGVAITGFAMALVAATRSKSSDRHAA